MTEASAKQNATKSNDKDKQIASDITVIKRLFWKLISKCYPAFGVVFLVLLEYVRLQILDVPPGIQIGTFDMITAAFNNATSLLLISIVVLIAGSLMLGLIFVITGALTVAIAVGAVVAYFAVIPIAFRRVVAFFCTIGQIFRWTSLRVLGIAACVPALVSAIGRQFQLEENATLPSIRAGARGRVLRRAKTILRHHSRKFLPGNEQRWSELLGKRAKKVDSLKQRATQNIENQRVRRDIIQARRNKAKPKIFRAYLVSIVVSTIPISVLMSVSNHVRVMESVGLATLADYIPPVRPPARFFGWLATCYNEREFAVDTNNLSQTCARVGSVIDQPARVYLRLATRHGVEQSHLNIHSAGAVTSDPFLSGPYYYIGDFGEWAYLVEARPRTRMPTAAKFPASAEDQADNEPPRRVFLRRSAIAEFSLTPPVQPRDVPVKTARFTTSHPETPAVAAATAAADDDDADVAVVEIAERLSDIERAMDAFEHSFDQRLVALQSGHRQTQWAQLLLAQNVRSLETDAATNVQDTRWAELLQALGPLQHLAEHPTNDVVLMPLVVNVPSMVDPTGAGISNDLVRPTRFELFPNRSHDLWRETCNETSIRHTETFSYLENALQPEEPLAERIASIAASLDRPTDGREINVFVIGSASFTGDPLYNLILSEGRAEFVARAFAHHILSDGSDDPLRASGTLLQEHHINLVSYGVGELAVSVDFILPRTVQLWVCTPEDATQ